tara:strand:+ start:218 stop:757 length:540 start_codon:yes stop_codon:yes gene_type:complete
MKTYLLDSNKIELNQHTENLKITFPITRVYDGLKGHVSVQGGVYSEGNKKTYKSKIKVDGQWYPISDHIDDWAFKTLIKSVTVYYKTGEINSIVGVEEIKKSLFSHQYDHLCCPMKTIYDKKHTWDYKPKVGDSFTGYGIQLDLSTLWTPQYQAKSPIDPKSIVSFEIEWSNNINFKNT